MFERITPEARTLMYNLIALVDKLWPLRQKFRDALPKEIAQLSHLLTSERAELRQNYLSTSRALGAYLRYFLPWNVYRLCRLLPALDLGLKHKDRIIDLGSGPLTFPIALWIARPELRNMKLEFFCVDRMKRVLGIGKELFYALTAPSDWALRIVPGDFWERPKITHRAALVSAVNVFNESLPAWGNMGKEAGRAALVLKNYARDKARILIVEPGVPNCGYLLSDLRTRFAPLVPLAPCTHTACCPLDYEHDFGGWCHFAFSTYDAPAVLHKLSAKAGIPKERAVLSFLFMGKKTSEALRTPSGTPIKPRETPKSQGFLRVISDAFKLSSGKYGRYGCCEQGLVLVCGTGLNVENIASGALLPFDFGQTRERDPKSGALLVNV